MSQTKYAQYRYVIQYKVPGIDTTYYRDAVGINIYAALKAFGDWCHAAIVEQVELTGQYTAPLMSVEE